MDLFAMHTEEYYKKLIELQEKLRKSEEERLKLEMKFNEMIQQSREDEQKHYRKLRTQYKQFLDEDRKRQNRNEKILISLDRIENRVAVLKAKSERFKLLRDQYHAFVTRIYRMQNVVKRNDEEMNCMKQMPKEEIDDKLNGWKNEASDGDYFESIIKRPNYANAIADDIINEIYAKQTANESICNNEEIEELKSIVNDGMSKEVDKSMRLNEDESSKEQVELLLDEENIEENGKIEEIDELMSAVKVSENELQEDKVIDVITNESVNDEGQKDEMINNGECIKDRQSEENNVAEETNENEGEDNLAENYPLDPENNKQIEYNEKMHGNNDQAEENVEQYSNVYQYDDNAVIQQQQYEDYVQQSSQHEEYDETNQQYANNEMYQQYDENGQPIQYEEYDQQQQFVQYDENGQPIMGQEQYYNEDGQLTTTYDEELQQQYDQQLLIEGNAEEYQQQQTVEEQNEEINGEEYQQQPVEEGNEEINEHEQVEEIVNENATVKTVMDMLDTDTESSSVMAKQTEEAKDSDFDFSNN